MNDLPAQLRQKYEPQEIKSIPIDPQCSVARFSPNGERIAAAGYDGRVRRWDATTDELAELPPLAGHNGWVTALAFAPQDDLLFSGDSWGRVRATGYRQAESTLRWELPAAHDGWVRELAASPDGARLASSGADKRVRIWSTADGAKQHEFAIGSGPDHAPFNGSLAGDVSCLRFTADGKFLLTGDLQGVVQLWDVSNWQSVRRFDAGLLFKLDRLQDCGGVRALAIDSEQRRLAVVGVQPKNGGTVVGLPTALVFDFATAELQQTLVFGQPNDCFVSDAQWHRDGFLIVVTCGTPGSGQLAFQRPEDPAPFFSTKKMINCQSVSLHPDGRGIVVLSTSPGSNGNGRPLTKDGKYEGARSPITLLRMPDPAPAASLAAPPADAKPESPAPAAP